MITLNNKYLDEKLNNEQKLELIKQTEQTDFSSIEDNFCISTSEQFIEDYFTDYMEDHSTNFSVLDIVKRCIGFSCMEELARNTVNKISQFYLGINCVIIIFSW